MRIKSQLTPSLRDYLARLDRYRMDLDLPEYEDSEDEARDLEELDDLWNALTPGDRSHSDYKMHCSEYLNPIEQEIVGVDFDDVLIDPRRKGH